MEEIEQFVLTSDEENLTFTKKQIEYLQDEFERQRRWVNLLSTREKLALEELEQTQNSISYRFGRLVTWVPRKIMKIFESNRDAKIVYFVKEDEEEKEEELFPSSLLITPELLPTNTSERKVDYLVEEVLIAIKRGNISVNQARDMFTEGAFTLNHEQTLEAADKIMNHILKVKEYQPSVKNIYVGILRSLAQNHSLSAITFGESFQDTINDKRALRALVQSHGKCGNFSKPLQYLRKMPKNAWRNAQEAKFSAANKILNKGLKIKMPNVRKIESKNNAIIYHASQSIPHTSSGYAIRTHGLVSALNNQQLDVQTILRHGYPLDRNDFAAKKIPKREKIDNVMYHFSHSEIERELINYQDVYNFTNLEKYLRRAISNIVTNAELLKPEIIHSASNFVVGMAGAKAAKELGIPSIYEIRGFWHLTQSTKEMAMKAQIIIS